MHTYIYIYAYIHYTWLACKTDISEEVRNHRSDVISRLFVVPRPHRLFPDHSFLWIHATGNNQNGHKLRCSQLISGTKTLQFVTFWKMLSLSEICEIIHPCSEFVAFACLPGTKSETVSEQYLCLQDNKVHVYLWLRPCLKTSSGNFAVFIKYACSSLVFEI